jgi:hypothetical protein
MGVKLLVESSASDSEMLVMDFDGCGCVSACEGFDGVRDKQLLELRGARATWGSLCAKTLGRCGPITVRGWPHSERNSHLLCSWEMRSAIRFHYLLVFTVVIVMTL